MLSEFNQQRWFESWRAVTQTSPPEEYYRRLEALYSEPHRHYHNKHHIAECLCEFDHVREHARQPLAVELAVWFHDVVYDTRANDNEERSAGLAADWLEAGGASKRIVAEVRRMVLSTKQHDSSMHVDGPLMVDVDLSILGQSAARFQQYEHQIRSEYDWVADEVFAARRAEILE